MDFNVESLPYLLHAEYIGGWTCQSKGVFIDPDGIEYRYEDRNGWKSFYEENFNNLNDAIDIDAETFFANIQEVIRPDALFHNLNLCRIKRSSRGRYTNNNLVISEEMIADLMNSKIVYKSDVVIHDAPTKSFSLLVYDGKNGCYKDVFLSSTGSRNVQNSSVYTDSLVAKFPRL